ncbi:MAG TPA: TDP-N-acetylfucosamine:lipid II N-acetylfucosaminyltransferase [Thermotogota bacterium]|nr:TDP-N-acetylfucosamine:lipid II N-acetylfucosaminyltransferase [Thermotogota bacterium]
MIYEKRIQNLHIMPNSIYTNAYIEFINKYFAEEDHVFFVSVRSELSKLVQANNVTTFSIKCHPIRFIKLLRVSNKIFLHGFFYRGKSILYWYLNSYLLKKSYWVIWGGDLYFYKHRPRNFKSNLTEFFRKRVIKKIPRIISFVPGDYELARNVYGVKAKYYPAFYPNPISFELLDKNKIGIENPSKRIILLGNSADPTNNHIEMINKLSKFSSENLVIICPLSYGNKDYANRVIEYGKSIFGGKFVPLLKLLNVNEYSRILNVVDIAIFNHDRQQAGSNITALLYLGKKVYIRKNTTTWQYFEDKCIKIYDTCFIEEDDFFSLFLMNQKYQKKNRIEIEKLFSDEKCVFFWSAIFG